MKNVLAGVIAAVAVFVVSTVYYIAKPGYRGPDEFVYAFIGKDQYGGPMRVTIKRRITVVP